MAKSKDRVKVTDAMESELQSPETVPEQQVPEEVSDVVNAPGATVNEDEGKPAVQPLETVPEQQVPVSRKEQCWNCKANDRRTPNRLDENGVCAKCGFEKGQLYNGNIEADKAAQRMEAARAAERGE